MPSPLNGLIEPAASPMASTLGPIRGRTDRPMGSFPPVGGPHSVVSDRPHDAGAHSRKAFMSWVVLAPFQRPSTERMPTPAFTRPSPMGNTQPYPGTTDPDASLMS